MNTLNRILAAALGLLLLSGCGGETPPAGDPAPEDPPAETAPVENPFTEWLPEGTETALAQTEHLPELAAVIADAYGIPEDALADTRYYYDYVDLNDDGDQEILAVVMGMYTSGTGGDSALLVQPYAGMNIAQRFTLVRTPILISDQVTGGAHDLIFLRSGGGSEPSLVRLTCTDGVYSNPADAEVLESLDGVTGKAILCNDLLADMDSGTALTLAGPQ